MLLVRQSRDRFPVVSLGIFSVGPPTEPCALRSTQPLKVSTRDFSWGKGGRCVWLTTYHPCSAETPRKSGALIYPEPLGATSACCGTPLPLPYLFIFINLKSVNMLKFCLTTTNAQFHILYTHSTIYLLHFSAMSPSSRKLQQDLV